MSLEQRLCRLGSVGVAALCALAIACGTSETAHESSSTISLQTSNSPACHIKDRISCRVS